MGACEVIDWHGERLELLADRAVYWAAEETLFIADPHFGKAAAFRSVGIAVPADSCQENCRRLSRLIHRASCARLVILGDFLHSGWGRSVELKQTLVEWRQAHEQLKIDLVRGNHDLSAGDPWPELRIDCHPEPWRLGPWVCRHEAEMNGSAPEFSGHLHPAISFAETRTACFWIRAKQFVLPAFGEFTGTHVIEPGVDDRVFATDGNEIIEIPAKVRR